MIFFHSTTLLFAFQVVQFFIARGNEEALWEIFNDFKIMSVNLWVVLGH